MTKLFKNSKQIFAFVIAFAIVAVSLFTGVAIDASATCGTNVVYVGSDMHSEDTKNFYYNSTHAGTKEDPFIIETPGQWRWLAQKATYETTYGKYFKIADGIDVLCFQTESYVTANFGGIDGLMSKTAEEVKEVLTTVTTNRTQLQTANSASGNFGGHIDGNGATFVGIYNANGGLFNTSYENVSFSNMTLSNCYFQNGDYTSAFVGSVVDSSSYVGYTSDSIAYENIVVRDCYITSLSNVNRHRIGVLLGMESLANGIKLIMDNCFIYNNVVLLQSDNSVGGVFGEVGNFGEDGGDITTTASGHFYNSIVLGVPIFNHNSNKTCRPANFKNYYTDIKKVIDPTIFKSTDNLNGNPVNTPFWPGWYSWDKFDDEKWCVIDAAKLIGDKAKVTCANLDFAEDWIVTEGYPTLRALHGELRLVADGTNGHNYVCADCNKAVSFEAHNWNANGVCTICGFVCNHSSQDIKDIEATCTLAQGVYSTCNICGFKNNVTVGNPLGHDLKWVAEDPATCEETGIKGYWVCKREDCNKKFLGENTDESKLALKYEPLENAATDADLEIPLAPHNSQKEDDSILVQGDEHGHWFTCYVCDGRLGAEQTEVLLPEEEYVKHKFVNSVCDCCKWECKNHVYPETGTVIVAGSCTVDKVEEFKCTICGAKKNVVTPASHDIQKVEEVPATDKEEGTKAHYKCTVCQKIYLDEKGTNTVTKALLIIPIKIPTGYEDLISESNKFEFTSSDTVTTVKDDKNEGNIKAELETVGGWTLDKNAVFVTNNVTNDVTAQEKENLLEKVNKLNLDIKDLKFAGILDLSLVIRNGNSDTKCKLEGKVKVSIDVSSLGLDKFENVKLVHFKSDDTAEVITYVLEGSKATFETDSFSNYAFVGTQKNADISDINADDSTTAPETGETVATVVAAVAAIIAAGFVFACKSRKA